MIEILIVGMMPSFSCFLNYLYFFFLPKETTQIEDPRVQWRQEQEHMLKDYLVLAQEALTAQKEIYQVKQQRLELAQQEYQQLHDVWEHKLGSQTSCEYLMDFRLSFSSCVLVLQNVVYFGHLHLKITGSNCISTCPLFC